jgi:hypothetical protein
VYHPVVGRLVLVSGEGIDDVPDVDYEGTRHGVRGDPRAVFGLYLKGSGGGVGEEEGEAAVVCVGTARNAGVGVEGGGEGRIANDSEYPGTSSAGPARILPYQTGKEPSEWWLRPLSQCRQ